MLFKFIIFIEVLSGPPYVIFTWRHWGKFDGCYRGNGGNGEVQKRMSCVQIPARACAGNV